MDNGGRQSRIPNSLTHTQSLLVSLSISHGTVQNVLIHPLSVLLWI